MTVLSFLDQKMTLSKFICQRKTPVLNVNFIPSQEIEEINDADFPRSNVVSKLRVVLKECQLAHAQIVQISSLRTTKFRWKFVNKAKNRENFKPCWMEEIGKLINSDRLSGLDMCVCVSTIISDTVSCFWDKGWVSRKIFSTLLRMCFIMLLWKHFGTLSISWSFYINTLFSISMLPS